jgi:hypothetical protein
MIIICFSEGRGILATEIPRKTPIAKCPPTQTNINWPLPVDQRLNELIELVVSGGFDVTRSQLLAALVSNAPEVGKQLERLIRQYRTETAGSVVLQRTGLIVRPPRKPGRRPR